MNRGPTGSQRDDNGALEIHLGAFLIPGMTFYRILLNETEQSSTAPFRQLNYHQNKGPYKAECSCQVKQWGIEAENVHTILFL